MQFNDVQRQILRDLRGSDDERSINNFEIDELCEMLEVCEDDEIGSEILSMLEHADE